MDQPSHLDLHYLLTPFAFLLNLNICGFVQDFYNTLFYTMDYTTTKYGRVYIRNLGMKKAWLNLGNKEEDVSYLLMLECKGSLG